MIKNFVDISAIISPAKCGTYRCTGKDLIKHRQFAGFPEKVERKVFVPRTLIKWQKNSHLQKFLLVIKSSTEYSG